MGTRELSRLVKEGTRPHLSQIIYNLLRWKKRSPSRKYRVEDKSTSQTIAYNKRKRYLTCKLTRYVWFYDRQRNRRYGSREKGFSENGLSILATNVQDGLRWTAKKKERRQKKRREKRARPKSSSSSVRGRHTGGTCLDKVARSTTTLFIGRREACKCSVGTCLQTHTWIRRRSGGINAFLDGRSDSRLANHTRCRLVLKHPPACWTRSQSFYYVLRIRRFSPPKYAPRKICPVTSAYVSPLRIHTHVYIYIYPFAAYFGGSRPIGVNDPTVWGRR